MAIAPGKKAVCEEAQEFDEKIGNPVPHILWNVMLQLSNLIRHIERTCRCCLAVDPRTSKESEWHACF
jgi:hypothetical protein